jgi:hypothetical protein
MINRYAQQQRQGAEIQTVLLATDQQRSVLHTTNSSHFGYTWPMAIVFPAVLC